MIRTISTGSHSWRLPIKVCCRDTAASTFRPCTIQPGRNKSQLEKGRRQIMKVLCLLVIALLTLSAIPLAAHDMWIEPTSFLPDAGTVVGLRLRIGQDFLGDPLPRDPALLDQFIT